MFRWTVLLALMGCPKNNNLGVVSTTPNPTATTAPRTPAQESFDLPYGEEPLMTFDLYLPQEEARGVVLFVHGGSWVSGDKDNLDKAPALVPWLTDQGLAVAAPNFRLASRLGDPLEVSWRDQCTDIAASLAAVQDALAVDVPVVLLGYSSGAHLVAMLNADPSWLDAAGVSHSDLAGSISLDVHAYDVPMALDLMVGSEIAKNIPLIEHLFGTEAADQLAASPASYIDAEPVAPSLLFSAQDSSDVGTHGYIASTASAAYATLLTEAGHTASHVHLDDESHSSLVLDMGDPDDAPTAQIQAFLDEQLPR